MARDWALAEVTPSSPPRAPSARDRPAGRYVAFVLFERTRVM